MSADRSTVALACDDLDRLAVRLVKHIGAMRIFADKADDHYATMAFLNVATDAAGLCSEILEQISNVNTARKARAEHAASK